MCPQPGRRERAAMVSSSALPVDLADEDLDRIDALIAEGLFSSRDEAVAYFLRAGAAAVLRVVDKAQLPGEQESILVDAPSRATRSHG